MAMLQPPGKVGRMLPSEDAEKRCEMCGQPGGRRLDFHHVLPRYLVQTEAEWQADTMWLCVRCHMKTEARMNNLLTDPFNQRRREHREVKRTRQLFSFTPEIHVGLNTRLQVCGRDITIYDAFRHRP